MVVGKVFTWEDLVNMAKHNKLTSEYHEEQDGEEEDSYEDWDAWDIISALEGKFPDMEFNSGLDNYYDEWCIGMGYDKMREDETRKEFESRIAKTLSDMTGKDISKVECMVDGGTDN